MRGNFCGEICNESFKLKKRPKYGCRECHIIKYWVVIVRSTIRAAREDTLGPMTTNKFKKIK